MRQIKLNLSGSNCRVLDVALRPPEDELFPTLKDLAMIMYACVTDGVNYQLAHELSKKLGIGQYEIYEAIREIIDENRDVKHEIAYKRYEETPNPYDE